MRAGLARLPEIVYTTLVWALIAVLLGTTVMFFRGYLGAIPLLLVAALLSMLVLGTLAGFRTEVERSKQLLGSLLAGKGDR